MIYLPNEKGIRCFRTIGGVPTDCIGPACSAWRWHSWRYDGETFFHKWEAETRRVLRDETKPLERLGFCGAAGPIHDAT